MYLHFLCLKKKITYHFSMLAWCIYLYSSNAINFLLFFVNFMYSFDFNSLTRFCRYFVNLFSIETSGVSVPLKMSTLTYYNQGITVCIPLKTKVWHFIVKHSTYSHNFNCTYIRSDIFLGQLYGNVLNGLLYFRTVNIFFPSWKVCWGPSAYQFRTKTTMTRFL